MMEFQNVCGEIARGMGERDVETWVKIAKIDAGSIIERRRKVFLEIFKKEIYAHVPLMRKKALN